MKKTLAILLAMLMIIAMFAGCSSSDNDANSDNTDQNEDVNTDNNENTDDDTDADTSEMTMQERLDAGESPLVAYCANNLVDSFLLNIVETVGEKMEAEGFTYQYVSAESNTATQINQIENFIEMGAVAIIVSPLTADSLKDTALRAIEQGCYIVYLGSTPADYEISGLVNVDQREVGSLAAEMMLTWVDDVHPDGVNAALVRYSNTDEMLSRTDAMEEVFTEDGRVNITYRKDLMEGTVSEGYNLAEEAMTMDPDLRLFACFSSSVALGCSNYIMAQSGLNLDEFASFGTEGSDEGTAAIDMSTDGGSIMRGLMSYGGADPADTMFQCTYDLLMGNVEAPNYCFDEVFTYNTVGYEIA